MSGYCTIHGQYSGDYCNECREKEIEEREFRGEQHEFMEEQSRAYWEAVEKKREQDEYEAQEAANEVFDDKYDRFLKKAKRRRCFILSFSLPRNMFHCVSQYPHWAGEEASGWREWNDWLFLMCLHLNYAWQDDRIENDTGSDGNGDAQVLTGKELTEIRAIEQFLKKIHKDDRLLSTGKSDRTFQLTLTLKQIKEALSY